ncbi:MAG: hypothetical protein WAL59_30770 [Roseiarcus sp.]
MNLKLCLFGARRLRDSAFLPLDEASSAGLGMVDFLEIAAAERSGVGDRVWRLYFFFGI